MDKHSQTQAQWRVRADRPSGVWDERLIWATDAATAIQFAARERGWYAATSCQAERVSDWRRRLVVMKRNRLPTRQFGLIPWGP